MNEMTIRTSPVKKWSKRTTFCKYSINISIYNKFMLGALEVGTTQLRVKRKHYLCHCVVRKKKCKTVC